MACQRFILCASRSQAYTSHVCPVAIAACLRAGHVPSDTSLTCPPCSPSSVPCPQVPGSDRHRAPTYWHRRSPGHCLRCRLVLCGQAAVQARATSHLGRRAAAVCLLPHLQTLPHHEHCRAGAWVQGLGEWWLLYAVKPCVVTISFARPCGWCRENASGMLHRCTHTANCH